MKELSMRDFLGELLTCEPELIAPDIQALDEEVIYVKYVPAWTCCYLMQIILTHASP